MTILKLWYVLQRECYKKVLSAVQRFLSPVPLNWLLHNLIFCGKEKTVVNHKPELALSTIFANKDGSSFPGSQRCLAKYRTPWVGVKYFHHL